MKLRLFKAISRNNFGSLAELIVAFYLRLKFYKIIQRRMRNYAGEIDLIATRGNSLVFIEVKARKSVTKSMELVTYKQQARIKRAAQLFVAQHTKFHQYDLRFDLVIISPSYLPLHIKNAW